jgi:hypothetical protein
MITNGSQELFANKRGCELHEELIYFICQDILGRGKGKGRIEEKR